MKKVMVVALIVAACAPGEEHAENGENVAADLIQVSGFSGPEAVRYDPQQDLYFVANFNTIDSTREANGFISRMTPDGTIDQLEFMVGTDAYPLHQPRGMFLKGDTLFVADADGVHGFNRTDGSHLVFIDFTGHDPGFLNDISATPDGVLHVTETNGERPRVYRIVNGASEVFMENVDIPPPNGIVWDAENAQFILAPWGGATQFFALDPESGDVTQVAESPGGRFDGAEFWNGYLVAASQVDQSLHYIQDGEGQPVISVDGRPADIGIDTRRDRVAVPYIALDRVDIIELPAHP